jgi:hypothetical protein
VDKLDEIFKRQESLQKAYGGDVRSQGYRNEVTLAAITELVECLQEQPWRWWRNDKVMNREKAVEELIDAQHHIVNIALSLGMTSDEFFDVYIKKNERNLERPDHNRKASQIQDARSTDQAAEKARAKKGEGGLSSEEAFRLFTEAKREKNRAGQIQKKGPNKEKKTTG